MRDAQTRNTQELKKVQRQLAGVTGAKDDEIERLETRVATLEVTVKSRNAEARSLQGQCEELRQEVERIEGRRRKAEEALAAAKRRIVRLEEDVKHAQESAREAIGRSQERERAALDGMRDELGEEGLLEAALERSRDQCEELRRRLQEAERTANRAPSSQLEMECSAMRSQVVTLERDLVDSKSTVNRLRKEEVERISQLQRDVEAGGSASGGGIAKDLDKLLEVRLRASELEGELQDAREECRRLQGEMDDMRREAEEAVVAGQQLKSNGQKRLEEAVAAEREEAVRVKGEMEIVIGQLFEARGKLLEMESLRAKAERGQEALESERSRRIDELKAAEEEAGQRKKDWEEVQAELEGRCMEWRRRCEEGEWGKVQKLEAEADELRLAAIEEMENLQARIDELEEEVRAQAKEAVQAAEESKYEAGEREREASRAAAAAKTQIEAAQGKLRERDGTIRGLQTQIATYEQAQNESFEEVQLLREQVCPRPRAWAVYPGRCQDWIRRKQT